MNTEHELTSDERARVQVQVDHFITVLERRYGVKASDVIEAVHYVTRAKERNAKLGQAGAASLIGTIIMAAALSLWEGIKYYARGQR
jgi:hypothetical protein